MFGSAGTVLLLHVALSFPSGPLGRTARVAVGFAWLGVCWSRPLPRP